MTVCANVNGESRLGCYIGCCQISLDSAAKWWHDGGMEKQKTTANTPDVYLCPHCGRGVWMSGERPYHMAYCKGVAGCGWYGLLENCTVFNPLKDTDVD